MPGGRPTKLTKELIERIVKHIRCGNFRLTACAAEGVPHATYGRWMRQGKKFQEGLYGEFRDAVLEAERLAETDAISAIYKAGDLDVNHLKWWAERKHSAHWARDWRRFFREVSDRLRKIEEGMALGSGSNATGAKGDSDGGDKENAPA